MKKILFFALLAASLSATAQNVNYSLDMIRPDSFYLIETITALPSTVSYTHLTLPTID